MSTIKERLPASALQPVGIGSLLLGVAGLTIGYILLILGITFVYGLAPHELPLVDSLLVLATGLVSALLGYAGLKGFMHFSY
ncbi:hypothetical protein GCM10027435_12310 [Haloparvum alkalitolerans]|uniref:hypothetical protein n=1 Tax=Haloparvum TaxID=1820337 RepID=UPI00071E9B75|nr:hypothetical protein [Haloparvum sedimenti]